MAGDASDVLEDAPTRPAPDGARWGQGVTRAWRRSLRFRTVAIMLGLTATVVVVACVWLALAIQTDLFQSRRDQVLADSRRATQNAQTALDSAIVQGDTVQLQNLMTSVRTALAQDSGTSMLAGFRIDVDPGVPAPQNFTLDLPESLLSAELRDQVTRGDSQSQWWQSVTLTSGARDMPGIVVGQQLDVPAVGPYELYFAYDLSAASETSGFVARALWVVAIALLVLIGAIAWFVLRAITVPIAAAADTSAQLAAGNLRVRLPVRGEDELATLGRSFNAMADSIETQIKELAELSQVQQRFVSDVSHELRTPMTTIRLAADMINDQRSQFDGATARSAELLYAQVQRFEQLLDDLLEISRYDAGSVELVRESTSLVDLAQDIVDSMQPVAEHHATELSIVSPDEDVVVSVDPRRIRRIISNLVGNAIEHAEGRPIVITVAENDTAVALGVRDFGQGMAPADSARVFDRFWRADPSRARTIGGSGLGLSIAAGDAALHQGTLAVWSELGGGANFVLTLPKGEGPVVGPSPVPLRTPRTKSKSKSKSGAAR